MKSILGRGAVVAVCLAFSPALAEEAVPEKGKAVKNDAARTAKKAAHRAKEVVCLESDAECLAKKAKHRATEAGDAVGDKAEQTKDKVD